MYCKQELVQTIEWIRIKAMRALCFVGMPRFLRVLQLTF